MHIVPEREASIEVVKGSRPSIAAVKGVSSQQLLFAIVLLAVALRALAALYQGNLVDSLPGIHDQISYDALARRVIDGHGFSFSTNHWPATRANEPTAHWSYLYTLYLSVVYLLFGAYPLAARLIQAVVVGILHTWLAWRIGDRIFGPVVGLLAALLSAIYLYFVYYASALITESFYIVAILWTLDVALRIAARQHQDSVGGERERSVWWLWMELGTAMGMAILLRQLFVLFASCLFLWLWLAFTQFKLRFKDRHAAADYKNPRGEQSTAKQHRHLLGGFALAATTLAILIAPWTVRNYQVFGQFVPLNTNSGYAFFWGNHPIYGTHFVGILPETGPSYHDLIPRELLALNEAALDQALLKRGLGFVVDDPGRYLLLSLSRGQEYFKFWPSAESSLISNVVRVCSFGVTLPFILYGLWHAARCAWRRQNRHRQMAIALLLLFVAFYTAVHLLVWTLIRYRLPVDSVLLIFAALGMRQILHHFGEWVSSHPPLRQRSFLRNLQQHMRERRAI